MKGKKTITALLAVACILLIMGCDLFGPSTKKEITSFQFLNTDNAGLSADITGVINDSEITLTLPYGTDLTHLFPSITYIGKSISPTSGTAQDFSGFVVYQVTAGDGSTADYTVIVLIDYSYRDIISFSFKQENNPDLNEDIEGTIDDVNITVHVPWGTDVTSLKASFETKGHVSVNAVPQVSDQTTNDFSEAVSYAVTASEGVPSRVFIITVIIDPITKTMLKEMIANNEDVTGLDTSSLTDLSYLFLL